MGRKQLTDEQKKAAYEKQKAAFREWYAKPENKAKKMAANQQYKEAHRAEVNAYARDYANAKKRVTMVKKSRAERTVTVWFMNRAEMNKWLRANDFEARRNHKVYNYETSEVGLWVRAGAELYVTIFGEKVSSECLHFSS